MLSLRQVAPGETYTYVYNIPPDHAGGTFWYHPHRHGSTAGQAGGGMAGALIVDDEPTAIPPQIRDAPDLPITIFSLDMSLQNRASTRTRSRLVVRPCAARRRAFESL